MRGNFGHNKKRENGSPNRFGSSNRSSNQQNGSNIFFESAETTNSFNDRQDYLLINSIGSNVTTTTTNGIKYSGVLVSCNPESKDGIDIVLKFPKVISTEFSDDIDVISNKLGKSLLIRGEDVAELELNDIDFSLDDKFEKNKKAEIDASAKKEIQEEIKQGFRTDIDISRASNNVRERELQKWTPDVDDMAPLEQQTLEESSSNWDQFAVNEKKFGVKSTFDEHLYTTKINKNDPNFEKRLKEAERIAKEIESQGTSGNIHIAEDRGIIVDDSGLDEEDKYSGVDRRGNELLAALKSKSKPTEAKPAKYVPPTLRNQPHHNDPAIISSTTTNTTSSKSSNIIGTSTNTTVADSNVPLTKSNPKADAKTETKTETKAETKAEIKVETKVEAKVETEVETKVETSIETKTEPKADSKTKSKGDEKSSGAKSSKISGKDAQIEDLKKFSQKFRVPYEVPEDMKDFVKKSTSKGESNEKHTKSSSSTAPTSKSESRTRDGKSQQSGSGRSSTGSKRHSQASFFGSKVPQANNNKKALFTQNFNMFKKAKEAYDLKSNSDKSESKTMERFMIEKPYFTAPTWDSTIEQSYKNLFPDERVSAQKAQMRLQQRQMNSMNAAALANSQMGMSMGNMMRYPMNTGSGNPMMNGAMGMYMPFQPQPVFYPSMPQMMGVMGGTDDATSPVSPQATSQQFGPAYGIPGAPVAAYGYPTGIPFQAMMGNNANSTGGHYRGNNHNNNHYNHHHNHGNNHNKNNYENRS
ncbi:hypothetical protein Kpol_2002p88 [Vanderwaltozyma polyspora DSM 70294]|uniref:LsmAD domain-containing protein n=1 Tax=Vanderwaltozyma polyspora (strain ATCC 22028 / DSM 70294 / BCRC 21397 / CBS 2163 / NBRC 10782 / NRRL Y-8283 / UCD 57-17) TaxID=436907 RepID=A7TFK3_VANPO|nr:uncharacterized protein Kpol_2002p88 [Vanderwaltozyma polyspora DSM 70294]EDO19017.1 hypothetical protein Kpol_2002p88 [Vanderwaltozyma polyspora DSM 70294]